MIEKKFLKNVNPNKVVDVVKKILNFNKQQKGKEHPLDLARIARVTRISDHSNLKISTPKQMLQRLPTALAKVKARNTFENLLNEIRQIIYYLYRAKEINKKVYNNIMNSIKLQNRIDSIFMNSERSKTSDPHRPLLNLTEKINLKRGHKYVALSNLSI